MNRNTVADLLEEAARGRRASSRSSAALGKVLKHLGAARILERVADVIRADGDQ